MLPSSSSTTSGLRTITNQFWITTRMMLQSRTSIYLTFMYIHDSVRVQVLNMCLCPRLNSGSLASEVAENRCWSCEFTCLSRQDLQNHLHEASSSEVGTLPWSDDKYLRPFIQDDPLLYSFSDNYEPEDEDTATVDKITDLVTSESIHIADANRSEEIASTSSSCLSMINPLEEANNNGAIVKENGCLCDRKLKDEHLGVSFAKVVANEIKKVNKNYFGSYSSFGIHREMISDKVRTDAYRQALLNNPSLLHGAAVLDVGCGTGILSLFAAQAGASSVIAVEASDKMAAVATEIAKGNGFSWAGNPNNGTSRSTGVIRVVQGMVEELDKLECIQPQSVDVLLSEWMGYCLLYESMLTSVLLARDRWLKPGGAILPDTATIFVAGFGRGGTSIPFWEDVYGFNMSCIGKELFEEAARIPIVDVVDSHDIVTNSVVLQSFDLLRMTHDEMDFTSRIELEPLPDNSPTNSSPDATSKTTWCYGVVLWFETGFTSRFCKEMPIVLSTSPYTPRTHWSQTILTFREPIAMALGKPDADRSAAVGTAGCPASKILSRISIARASEHRSIDISLEIAGLTLDGRKHSWPAQIFNLS
ncbi:probable protein arginine N-methyltransferase 3 isoform X2 [Diospyros lotus]|uniref:probable protein arginine N-methyltransferase 3 isoform X2 n=1 Tax=Diospyros lotus TaxID=55363 RepID=UPI0022538E8C|nr:probable protein arginine N-methyltransferase 3 isoform X2 [Diospyros lotus]